MNLWLDNQGRFVSDFPMTEYYSRFSEAPADVPAYGDSVWVGSWPDGQDTVPRDFKGGGYGGGRFPHTKGRFMGRFAIQRHGDGIDLSFVDGHVNRVSVKGLWALNWHRDNVPNVDVKIP